MDINTGTVVIFFFILKSNIIKTVLKQQIQNLQKLHQQIFPGLVVAFNPRNHPQNSTTESLLPGREAMNGRTPNKWSGWQ
jgi:hypothetical protein